MKMKTAILSFAGAAALMFGLAPSLSGQTGAGDEGTFEVYVDGRLVGTEVFTIRQTGVGSNAEAIASGRVELNLPTGMLVLLPRLHATGFQADPVAYEITVEGDAPRTIVGTVGEGRFSARILSPTGEQLREYVASSGATILEEGVAHHYYFLARRSRNGRVPILIPRENRQVMATVTDRGEEQVEVAGSTVSLFHLVVQPDGGAARHIWVDALNRVIVVEIPDQGYRAVRTTIPR